MGINLQDPVTFSTAMLVGDTGPGGTPPTITLSGGVPVATALEIQSTLGALLLPRMTNTQMNALSPVVDGMVLYNITNTSPYSRQGGAWVPIGSGGGGGVSSISQGSNIVLSPNPIVTTGSVSLNPVLTGLTSAVIGNISISTTANTISGSAALNVVSTSSNVNLTANGGGGNINISGNLVLGSTNALTLTNAGVATISFRANNSAGSSTSYVFPAAYPGTNGQVLSSDTSGNMSWSSATGGTVTSITAGSNLTGGTITTSGTIGLSASVSGLTSLSVGNFTISGSTIASTSGITVTALAALTLNPTQIQIGTSTSTAVQLKSGSPIQFFNPANTFSSTFAAGTQGVNLSYLWPLTAPTNGQVLSSDGSGNMSWASVGTGSVTSISQGANITCTPNPIVNTGTVALNTTLTGLTSVAIGNMTITNGSIAESAGALSITTAGSITLTGGGGSGVISSNNLSVLSNLGLSLYNSGNTNSITIIPGASLAGNFTYTLPQTYPSSNGQVLASTTAGVMSWTSAGGAPSNATYIVQQTNVGLPNAQALQSLATGLVKNTTGTGVLSIAVAGTDYYSLNSPTRILDGHNGTGNFAIGFGAYNTSATGNSNTIVGVVAGAALTSGSDNCLFGYQAGALLNTQSNNVLIGNNCAISSLGSANTFIGSVVGNSLTDTSSNNTWVGYAAGTAATTGVSNSVLLGNATTISNGITNATAIGYNASVTSSNCLVLGSGANVGIGVSAPSNALQIANVGTSANANIFISNTTNSPPSGGASGGGFLFVSGGALFYIGSNGTTTILAPA